MKQSMMVEPRKIKFNKVDKPVVNDDEVLMETKRIGICGSDIHVFHGLHPYTSYPIVQGHEVSGVVREIGKNVTGVSVGDQITFTPQVTCGTCFPCKNGMYHICENLKVMGFQTNGAGQEFFTLPEWNVVKLPDNMPLDYGAFIEPVAVAVHALERGGNIEDKKVLVLGAGTIGNLVAQSAKALGAKSVMITDIQEYKLEIADSCGIDFPVNSSVLDINKAIEDSFGINKADIILECVGVQTTITQAINVARKGTTIVVVGVFGENPIVDLGLVQDRELNIIGSLMYQKADFEKAVELVASKKINLEHLITHRFHFNQYMEAYQTIDESQGKFIKVMIELD